MSLAKYCFNKLIHDSITSLLLKLGNTIISKSIARFIMNAFLISILSPIILYWDKYVLKFFFKVKDGWVNWDSRFLDKTHKFKVSIVETWESLRSGFSI